MNAFDLNCMLGPTSTNREPSFRTAEPLLAEMDRVGIAEALVYASQARMSHPADGNARVLEATRDSNRLHPCWVLMPPGTAEQPAPPELVARMRSSGVRAARMFPREHNIPFLERSLRPLLAALAEAEIPLLLDTGRTGWGELSVDWRELFAIAEAHPALRLILLREGGTTERVLFPVWHEFPNLFLETSYIQESRVVEEIVGRFGHRQLLFGTGMPFYDPGGPLSLLRGAQVTREQRADMAGNTTRHLLGLAQAPVTDAPEWPCGRGGFRVFDAHGHVGRWERKYFHDASAAELVARMDEVGIERFAVSDILACGPDYQAGNTRVGTAVAAFPDRLVGYAVYNPNYESEMGDEMRRAFDELGCRGIKLHCSLHDTSTEDRSYRLAFRMAQEQRCPILCHAHRGPSPGFLMETLAEYPDATFIYAHLGGGRPEGVEPLLEVAQARPNLVFDLGVSVMPRATLAWLVDHVPPTQIVYGSDHPLNEFTFQLGRVLYADIAEETKRIILWDNAARIFGIT